MSLREEEVLDTQRQNTVEKVPEKTATPIKMKVRHDKDQQELVYKVNQETTEEETQEEPTETLQRHPRKRDTEQ